MDYACAPFKTCKANAKFMSTNIDIAGQVGLEGKLNFGGVGRGVQKNV